MGVLGVPVMSKQSFMQTEHQIGEWWWNALQESTTTAGIEEKQFAIEQGSYHQDIPATVLLLLLMEDGVNVPINTNIMFCLESE